MISTRISLSKKAAAVSWAAEVIYLRIIPQADDVGRLTADLEELRAVVIPLGKKGKRVSVKQLRGWLEELHNEELIVLYSDNGNDYLQVTNFDTFQTIKGDRPKTITCPEPTEDGVWIPMDSNASHSLGLGLGSSPTRKGHAADAALVDEFENVFWPPVRKKETKADTLRLFVALRKKGVPLVTILSGLKEYQRAKADDDIKYLMQPARFLGPGRHWEEWAEKATVAEDNARRSREALQRREKTVLKRTVQPTNPNPDMAKQLRELAKDLGEGKGVER